MDTETQEEHHVIPEAEIGVILPQAKECQGSLASSRSQEKDVGLSQGSIVDSLL